MIALTACAVPKNNYRPKQVQLSEPPLNEQQVAYVGDSLVKQASYAEHDAIRLRNETKIGLWYTASTGFYLKEGEDKNSEYYNTFNGTKSGDITKTFIADPWEALLLKKDDEKYNLCIVTIFNAVTCANQADFEKTKKPVYSSNSFQQTLIYSGKIGDKINIGYREFSDNMARPAFNNDVEYDLSRSDTIGYKGAKLKVLDADNEKIRYIVLRNFNKSEF
jgi:hypothetical protein